MNDENNSKRGKTSLCAVEEPKGAEWMKCAKSVVSSDRLGASRKGNRMLKELYEEVQGIIHKCRNEYYLHLWELYQTTGTGRGNDMSA